MKKRMKKLISCLLIATMLSGIVNVAYADEAATVDLTDNLIAYYDFEGAEGTTVANKANAETFSGTLVGNNVSIEADGILGDSLKFTDGTEGRMEISNIMNVATTSYSLSMWYKYDTSFSRGNKTVLFQQNGGGRTLLTLTQDNKYHTYVNTENKTGQGTVDVNQWQHVTIAIDATNKKVSFYINGVLDSTQDAGASPVNELTGLLVGRHKNSGTDPLPMRGLVDEIRVYDELITAEKAQAIYEEKAGTVKFPLLQEKIAEAEGVYNSARLDASDAAAASLKQSIDTAKGLTANISYTQLEESIAALTTKIAEYNSKVGVNITVNTNEIERVIDESTFGINHRYAFNGYGSFDSETMQMKEDFVKLYEEAGFGSIRYPGGTISNLFRWKTSIGPKENRVKQIHGFYNNSGQNGIAPNFGLDEIGTFADQVGSEIVYVYGFGRGSAQDAADLVEYLNAPVGSNPNGGVAWASVRAKNGHAEPYNVRYYEIGNENQQAYGKGSDGTASQGYWLDYAVGGAEKAYVEGARVEVEKQYAVLEDNWNRAVSDSTGEANQVRYMRYANPNPMTGEDGTEFVEDFEAVIKGSVHVYVNDVEWPIVESFENQAADAQVVTVDYRDGSFRFGDGVHGAIPASGATITVSYNVDREGFADVSRAMKETTQEINEYYAAQGVDKKLECHAYSSYETTGFINKMRDLGFNDLYDGFTIHPYSGTPSGTGEAFYDDAMKKAIDTGVGRVQHFVDMLPEGKVPVISEYGIFRSTDLLVRSQTHALYIARVLMEYVRLGSPYIQKHCLIDWYSSGADSLGPTQQAVIQAVAQEGADTKTGEGEFTFFATPSARVFEMICNNFGTDIIPSEFSFMEQMSNGVDEFASLASKDADGNIYLAVVNLDKHNDSKMHLVVEGMDVAGRKVEIQTLAGDSFDAANTPEDPDNVDIENSTMTATSNTISFTAKAHSFNIVKVVASEAEEVKLDKTELSLEIGKTATLGVTVLPEDTYKKDVTFSSSDDTVATVDANGVVTAVKTGTATITVTTSNGKTATCTVTVPCNHTTTEVTGKKDASCTEAGYTGDTICTTCKDVVKAGEAIVATGHTSDKGTVTVQPTTTKPGVMTYTCVVCKDVVKTEKIPADKPSEDKKPVETPKKGSTFVVKGATYKITKAGAKNGTVTFVKTTNTGKSITIPATIKSKGITYNVTAIEKNAFKNNKKATKIVVGKNVSKIGATAFNNCKSLKEIKFQTTKLTKKNVLKNAFKGIKNSVKIKVPSSKVKAYKTLFQSKGLSKKVKVTK